MQQQANVKDMAPKTKETAITKKSGSVLDYLQQDKFKQQLAMALPKALDSERFIRSAISEFRLNPALQDCSVASVLGFYMQAAMCGLEPASVLGQCYPVPFYNNKTKQKECQFILGYRGMAAIARRSGEVLSIDAQIVHAKDHFRVVYGLDPTLEHEPFLDGDAGAVRGAYCIVKFKDGNCQYKYMPKKEIDAHRSRSKSGKVGPWASDYEEMAKKTVFRALFKWLPITIEQSAAVTMDATTAQYRDDLASADDLIEVDYTVARDEYEEETEAAEVGADPDEELPYGDDYPDGGFEGETKEPSDE